MTPIACLRSLNSGEARVRELREGLTGTFLSRAVPVGDVGKYACEAEKCHQH
jgi:hypothetical protein